MPSGHFIGSGGGISEYEPEPAYQPGVQSTGNRTTPDVSLVADPNTGVWIADTYNLPGTIPFEIVGGTSLSAPAWAGLLAAGEPGPGRGRRADPEQLQPTETQQALYSLPTPITTSSQRHQRFYASTGYNLVTGLGTPVANLLVPDLVAYKGLPPSTSVRPSWLRMPRTPARSNGGDTTSVFGALTATGSGLSGVPSPAARLATSLVNLCRQSPRRRPPRRRPLPPHSDLRSQCRSARPRLTDPASHWARSRIPATPV